MTKSMEIREILNNINDYELIGVPQHSINGIAYDSRKVQPRFCFVAIQGDKEDGHKYIEEAISKGATLIVCEKLPQNYNSLNDVVFILTKNSRKFLAQISHSFYDFPANKLKTIAVTGTNGKTTITFLIKSIVESAKLKCGIIGTTGIYIGDKKIDATHTTPESLELSELLSKMVDEKVDYVVMEVSSHSLVQNRVYGINFAAAIFTNLTHDHLDYHHNMVNYAAAKKYLFENLSEESHAVINSDSEWAEYMVRDINCQNISRVGRTKNDEYRIIREEVDISGIVLTLYNKNEVIDIVSSMTGSFNIENLSLAAVACRKLGLSTYSVQHGLSVSNGAPGRMQRINLMNGAIALVDYAHTPDALEKALKSCKNLIPSSNKKSSKLISLFGCGGDRDRTKRPEMGKISSQIADISIITSDNPRSENPDEIIKDILTGIETKHKYLIITDRLEAIKKAVELSKSGDIILVAGKGHENYQIIGGVKHHFDDVEELEKFKSNPSDTA